MGKEQLFSRGSGGSNKDVGVPGVAMEQKNLKPLFTHSSCIFHSVGPAPLFPPPPPARLVIQEEEAKESNIVLEIGLEGQ